VSPLRASAADRIRRVRRPALLLLALASALALSGAFSGCGQKGPLYLPQQKKTKVPATPTNPAPDSPEASPGAPAPSSEPAPHA